MAKKRNNQGGRPRPEFKRVVTRAGRVLYFDGGKRVSDARGVKKYIQQQYNDLTSAAAQKVLTDSELRSLRAKLLAEKNREKIVARSKTAFRFGGRYIPKYLELLMRELKLIDDKSNRELKREFPDVRFFGELLRMVDDALSRTKIYAGQYGLENEKRKRETFVSVIDIAERLNEGAYLKLKLIVIKRDGERFDGGRARGLELIRNWEVLEIDDIMKTERNPAYVTFIHFADIDAENGTVTIDLRDSDSRVQTSP